MIKFEREQEVTVGDDRRSGVPSRKWLGRKRRETRPAYGGREAREPINLDYRTAHFCHYPAQTTMYSYRISHTVGEKSNKLEHHISFHRALQSILGFVLLS